MQIVATPFLRRGEAAIVPKAELARLRSRVLGYTAPTKSWMLKGRRRDKLYVVRTTPRTPRSQFAGQLRSKFASAELRGRERAYQRPRLAKPVSKLSDEYTMPLTADFVKLEERIRQWEEFLRQKAKESKKLDWVASLRSHDEPRGHRSASSIKKLQKTDRKVPLSPKSIPSANPSSYDLRAASPMAESRSRPIAEVKTSSMAQVGLKSGSIAQQVGPSTGSMAQVGLKSKPMADAGGARSGQLVSAAAPKSGQLISAAAPAPTPILSTGLTVSGMAPIPTTSLPPVQHFQPISRAIQPRFSSVSRPLPFIATRQPATAAAAFSRMIESRVIF